MLYARGVAARFCVCGCTLCSTLTHSPSRRPTDAFTRSTFALWIDTQAVVERVSTPGSSKTKESLQPDPASVLRHMRWVMTDTGAEFRARARLAGPEWLHDPSSASATTPVASAATATSSSLDDGNNDTFMPPRVVAPLSLARSHPRHQSVAMKLDRDLLHKGFTWQHVADAFLRIVRQHLNGVSVGLSSTSSMENQSIDAGGEPSLSELDAATAEILKLRKDNANLRAQLAATQELLPTHVVQAMRREADGLNVVDIADGEEAVVGVDGTFDAEGTGDGFEFFD